jgi:uncharacterized protein
VSLYLDASALVKLVVREPETAALRRYLRRHRTEHRVTSALARTEVVRAVFDGRVDTVTRARDVIRGTGLIAVDARVLDDAATLAPGTPLRSLDAIHLASARLLGADLRAVVTYDGLMADAAAALGLPVAAPGSDPYR